MQNKIIELHRFCPICQNKQGEVLHRLELAAMKTPYLPAAYHIVKCEGCGFVFADTSARQKDYDRYYQECSIYEDATISSGSGGNEFDEKRLSQTVSDIIAVLPDRRASIFDIGCANGGLLAAFKAKGYSNILGLDPSQRCVAHVQKLGIEGVQGTLFNIIQCLEASLLHPPFDCLVLSHVLEHVYDLQMAFQQLAPLQETGGVLFIEVPDASRYGEHFIVPYYYFDCEHINHFDENSLGNLAGAFGYEIQAVLQKKIEFPGGKTYPVVAAIFKKKKSTGSGGEIRLSFSVYQSVSAHIRQSQEANFFPEIENFSWNQEKIVVWGAGSFTLRLLKNSPLGECHILYFVDSNPAKQGKLINDIPVVSPSRLKPHTGPIIVSSALYSQEIISQIRSMGLKNRVVVLSSEEPRRNGKTI